MASYKLREIYYSLQHVPATVSSVVFAPSFVLLTLSAIAFIAIQSLFYALSTLRSHSLFTDTYIVDAFA